MVNELDVSQTYGRDLTWRVAEDSPGEERVSPVLSAHDHILTNVLFPCPTQYSTTCLVLDSWEALKRTGKASSIQCPIAKQFHQYR